MFVIHCFCSSHKSDAYVSLSIHINSSLHMYIRSFQTAAGWIYLERTAVLNTSKRKKPEECRHFSNFYRLLSLPFSKDNKKQFKIHIRAKEAFTCLSSCFVKSKWLGRYLYSCICLDYSRKLSLLPPFFFFIIPKYFVYLKLIFFFLFFVFLFFFFFLHRL